MSELEKDMSPSEFQVSAPKARTIICNAHRLLRRKYRGRPLWSLVADLTGRGRTMSQAFCLHSGLDPHQKCGGIALLSVSEGK